MFEESTIRVKKFAPYILSFAFVFSFSKNTFAANEKVDQILKSVEQKLAPPNERVSLKMVIQDSDGSKKERVLTILRKNEKGNRALIRLLQPSDLKGLSLLTIAEGDKEDQWLYLPSDKKSRRILGSNKKGKFLDSEISYEDLRADTYKDFNNKIVKEDDKSIQIESTAKKDSESSYGRVVTWIGKPELQIDRVDYYDKGGKLLKQATFKNYKKVGGKFLRAHQMLVTNVQAKRKTMLIVQKVSLKKISDDEISLSALED
jgi:hypothetical protein